MRTTKMTESRFDSAGLGKAFRALAEEKRFDILRLLAGGERCACDMAGCCDDQQPLASFHLKTLREAGLVSARRDGRWVHYRLERQVLRELAATLTRLADSRESPDGCCRGADHEDER